MAAVEAAQGGASPVRAAKRQAVSAYTKEDFLKVFPLLRDEVLTKVLPKYEMPDEAIEWFRQVIDYNVPGGKLNRGMTVVHALQAIRGAALSEEETREAAILGWLVEWLQAFFLVADDVMDQSITRRGQPCWYKKPEVGLIAINDGFLLQSSIYALLKNHFGSRSSYGLLLELFTETTMQTELGQLLDLTSNPMDGKPDLDRFTSERYHKIVKYKTAFYSFYLPVALAMVLGGVATDKNLEVARSILVDMGEYFQIQDDYMDCYVDPEVLGKVGTDIQDNKCSWLVVRALEKASDEQRRVLKEHYGVDKPESIECVKQVYKELELETLFKNYEEESYRRISDKIEDATKTCPEIPSAVFTQLLGKIYKRQK